MSEQTLQAEHSAMVRDLFKSDGRIYDSLKPGDCAYTHSILANAGEGGELVKAVRAWRKAAIDGPRSELEKALDQVAEERGDLEFYVESERQRLGDSRPTYHQAVVFPGRDVNEILLDLWEAEAAMIDPCKRLVIYRKHEAVRKPEDTDETFAQKETEAEKHLKDQTERARAAVDRYAYLLEEVGQAVGVTLTEALEANLKKLLKGDKARYKSGTYSDEQAAGRADKGGHDKDLDDAPVDGRTDEQKAAQVAGKVHTTEELAAASNG